MEPSSLFSDDVDNPLLEVAGEVSWYRVQLLVFNNKTSVVLLQVCTITSKHVLDVMFTRFKLLEHMAALRKYLLLGQGWYRY